MKKRTEFQKVYSKNYLKMNSIFWLNPDLLLPGILSIRKKFGIKGELSAIDPAQDKEHYAELIKLGSQKMKVFHKRLGAQATDFYKDLENIRKDLHLGREWNTTLARFAVSGIVLPPPFNLFVNESEDEKIIIFELNKNTTKDDLNLAWKSIEDIRKKMFNKVRANFPTKKGIDNFSKITALKMINSNEEVLGAVAGDKKYKRRKIEIIGSIYSDEDDMSEKADKKRMNKLKTAEHRLKKVTS